MPPTSPTLTRGLLLAAGSGSRMGRPKALVRPDPDGPSWVRRSVATLLEGGCAGVTVVIGAAADEVRREVADLVVGSGPESVTVVEAPDWAEGMGASLRVGLAAVGSPEVDAVLVHLVDLPDVGPEVIVRLLTPRPGAATLRRAAYDGVPGHPVVLGRDHWAGVREVSRGDRGARDHLRRNPVETVECGDLATGVDVDTSADLDRWAD